MKKRRLVARGKGQRPSTGLIIEFTLNDLIDIGPLNPAEMYARGTISRKRAVADVPGGEELKLTIL